MFKTIFTTLFFIMAVSPVFAIIMERDTTPISQCDTIIEKNGHASPVRIVSVGNAYISYKQCSDNSTKVYTIERSKVLDIKLRTQVLLRPVSTECDTIIEKNGNASPVRIVSVGNASITYKQCNDHSKKVYTIATSNVQAIKSETHALVKPKSIFERAKKALRFSAISTAVFFLSLIGVLPLFEGDGDGGNESPLLLVVFIAFLLSPFAIIGALFNCIDVLIKANKVGDKKAANKAAAGLLLSLLPIVLILIVIL